MPAEPAAKRAKLSGECGVAPKLNGKMCEAGSFQPFSHSFRCSFGRDMLLTWPLSP